MMRNFVMKNRRVCGICYKEAVLKSQPAFGQQQSVGVVHYNDEHRRAISHPVHLCPKAKNLCFRCLSPEHVSSECSLKIWTLTNQCLGCFLPLKNNSYHPNTFGVGRNCQNHVVKDLALQQYDHYQAKTRFCTTSTRNQAFKHWLDQELAVDPETGLIRMILNHFIPNYLKSNLW